MAAYSSGIYSSGIYAGTTGTLTYGNWGIDYGTGSSASYIISPTNTTYAVYPEYVNPYINATGSQYVNYTPVNFGYTTDNYILPAENSGIRGESSEIIFTNANYCVWPINKEDAFRNKLKSNMLILTRSRAELPHISDSAERIAMETLREHISESEFRKYLKYGFVLVKGQSGDVFQIFRNRSHTKVWRGGKLIEEICVRIKDSQIPPTDNVIAFRQIIQTSEEEFKKLGNVYKMSKAA